MRCQLPLAIQSPHRVRVPSRRHAGRPQPAPFNRWLVVRASPQLAASHRLANTSHHPAANEGASGPIQERANESEEARGAATIPLRLGDAKPTSTLWMTRQAPAANHRRAHPPVHAPAPIPPHATTGAHACTDPPPSPRPSDGGGLSPPSNAQAAAHPRSLIPKQGAPAGAGSQPGERASTHAPGGVASSMGAEKGKRGRPEGPSGQQNGAGKNGGGGQKAARTPGTASAGAGARGGAKGAAAASSASLRHISPIPLRESSEVRWWGWLDGGGGWGESGGGHK